MTKPILDPRIHSELKASISGATAAGELLTPEQIHQHTHRFQERFGPAVLRSLDGEALLRMMHGRQDPDSRSLTYWLEFKNDDEFRGNRFGGIGGGAALKFGIFQRQIDNAWITGSPQKQEIIGTDKAISIARKQRDELVAGCEILRSFNAEDISDQNYAQLQAQMEKVAPQLKTAGWAHKYWFLNYPDRLDDYHSPWYQRFHLLKLLQMPPDKAGILDSGAPRFNCAGRFIEIARQFDLPVTTLNTLLNKRDRFHRYWRVGTTEGRSGESHWEIMRDGGFVSIGWSKQVPNLSSLIGQPNMKDTIREWLLEGGEKNSGVASRQAGQISKFAQYLAEDDLVLACEGQTVLGVGRVIGSYEYDGNLKFPHKRKVEWLLVEKWKLPKEGLQTTIHEMGRYAENLLALEQRLFNRKAATTALKPAIGISAVTSSVQPLPPLDPFAARIENILRRKGQVVLYGPPGTGKTHHARRIARELAARKAFRQTFESLSAEQRSEILTGTHIVRDCTFHPGYSYEDFIEGLRPRTIDGRTVFEARDGIFKRLCADAMAHPNQEYFLIIDEINRGDVPRIFGELITNIELDKRSTPVTLPVTGSPFTIPQNVFLIGTMNTADRSISLLDTALRRRFGFVELMPDSSQLSGRKAGQLPLGPWLDALNARLRQHLKRDARNLQIGHAYLMPSQPITSMAEFARVLRDEIVPLLEEYCYDDFGKLRDILGKEVVDPDAGRIREEVFASNREDDLLQAMRFEEMEQLVMKEGIEDGDSAQDEPDDELDGGLV